MPGLAVVAVGGNSLIRDGAHQSIPDQYLAIQETARHIVDLVEAGWSVVVTHGNGPQVGFILLRSHLAREHVHPVPLDVCGADTQGAIGYHLQQALQNEMLARGIAKQAVTLVTQVVVDPADRAFQRPSKPIGPFMDEQEARRHEEDEGWDVLEDSGRGWRRVVASPRPQRIVELEAIRHMVKAGYVVVACGGGGVPVQPDEQGRLQGTAAVIDKDLASSLLALQLGADLLVISTSVEQVYLHYGTPEQQALSRVSPDQTRDYLRAGHFKAGSMKPKIEAILEFLDGGGKRALVTNPENLLRALKGQTGTHFLQETP